MKRVGFFALAFLPLSGCNCGLTPLDIVHDPGSIAGRICDPGEGRGLYGAEVSVVLKGGRTIDTISDGNGDFDLAGVPPGTYTVHVARGSFTKDVAGVVVAENKQTKLDEGSCVAPVAATKMLVVSGHDSVENVLTRLGEDNFTIVDSHFKDHTSSTPSWFVDEFADLSTMKQYGIIFINCGPHDWAIDDFNPNDVEKSLQNLRDYVAQGGSLYVSDWAYTILQHLYPDAAQWYGDGSEDAARAATAQNFTGDVVDADLKGAIGKDQTNLVFELSEVAIATSLGAISRPLITADVEVKSGYHDTQTLHGVPVLFEVKPADLQPGSKGRVLFTSFHNGPNNTSDMDDVLRAIVFTL